MAKIKIKMRREPIEIENEKAKKIKDRWLGTNTVAKADPADQFDTGVYSAEYGHISSIELDTPTDTKAEDRRKREEHEDRVKETQWLKMSPEDKGKEVGYFNFAYAGRVGDWNAQPPADVLKKVIALQTAYYTKHPDKRGLPIAEYGNLLPKRQGNQQSLAQKMTISKKSDRTCKNKGCTKKLPTGVKEYCSGSCMLEAKNGDMPT